MADKHVRRTASDYAHALAALLPTGIAWPREASTTIMRGVRGLAGVWGYVDGRAADLLETESDPRATTELLPEWERAWGLPDECSTETPTIGDRQRALVLKMTTEGGQSRDYFVNVAARLGYTVTIDEYSPFMVGISRVGSTPLAHVNPVSGNAWEIGPGENRFYWRVNVGAVRMTWFRVGGGGGQTGVDPFLRIALATDLECIFRRWKPAHTEVIFNYTPIPTLQIGDGYAAAVGTASGVGTSSLNIVVATGNASSSAVGDAVGSALFATGSGAGVSAGTGAASDPVASGINTLVSVADGLGLAAAAGVATIAASGIAAAISDAPAAGGSTASAAASSNGVGAATSDSANIVSAPASSDGTGSGTAVGSSLAAAPALAAGIGDAQAIGSSIVTAVAAGAATGAGIGLGVGTLTAAAPGTAAGVGASTAVGASTVAAPGLAAGSGTASAPVPAVNFTISNASITISNNATPVVTTSPPMTAITLTSDSPVLDTLPVLSTSSAPAGSAAGVGTATAILSPGGLAAGTGAADASSLATNRQQGTASGNGAALGSTGTVLAPATDLVSASPTLDSLPAFSSA